MQALQIFDSAIIILQSDRAELISQIRALKDDNRQFRSILDEKRKEIEPLQHALGKLRNANSVGRGSGICSSEEELNDIVCFFPPHPMLNEILNLSVHLSYCVRWCLLFSYSHC